MQHSATRNFDQVVLPHLQQAYNLARWLARNEQDASDIVQESCLRALRYFECFRGGDVRPWLLRIVRNTYYTWSRRNRDLALDESGDETAGPEMCFPNPEELAIQHNEITLVSQALESMPSRLREVLILRELEGLSYQEISNVMGIPIGTVMSSLSRARTRLRQSVANLTDKQDLLKVSP